MDHTLFVRRSHAVEDHADAEDPQRLGEGHRSTLFHATNDQVFEVFALDVLHHQQQLVVVDDHRFELDHIGMIDAGQRATLG